MREVNRTTLAFAKPSGIRFLRTLDAERQIHPIRNLGT